VPVDGGPTGSQDGTRQATVVNANHILIPTAGRAEFIVTAPSASVKTASLVTLAVNTGPDGDSDPQRTLATIQTVSQQTAVSSANDTNDNAVPAKVGPTWKQRFEKLATAQVTAQRTFYFSETTLSSSSL